MKKILAAALAFLLALSVLTACGGGNDSASSSDTSANSTSSPSADSLANSFAGSSDSSPADSPASNAPAASDAPAVSASNFDTSRLISVVTREEGSGTRDAVRDLFDIKDADGKENVTIEAIVADSTGVMMTNVANDPYAIGYCSLASLNDSVKALVIDGVAPSIATVKDGSYVIQRPFYLATMGEPDGLAKDFIDFILSNEGQEATVKRCIPAFDNAPAYSGSRPSGSIVVGGSSSVSPVMEDLIAAYKVLNPSADIELQVTDSSTGMNDAKSGAYDIGMASRELKESEIEDGLVPVFIAIDGIAVIVNAENPLGALTKDLVRDIYNGEIEVWNEVQ